MSTPEKTIAPDGVEDEQLESDKAIVPDTRSPILQDTDGYTSLELPNEIITENPYASKRGEDSHRPRDPENDTPDGPQAPQGAHDNHNPKGCNPSEEATNTTSTKAAANADLPSENCAPQCETEAPTDDNAKDAKENAPPREEGATTLSDCAEEDLPKENLSSRYLSQVPYQYKPTLVQYDENEEQNEQNSDYHFGLIRGHHREMYGEKKHKHLCSCCANTKRRLSFIKNRLFTMQIASVFLGSLLVFMGLAILIVTFAVLSDEAREYFWNAIKLPGHSSHILATVGLTMLTLGTALVSFALLVPLFVKRQSRWSNAPMFSCSAGDLYVKHAEKTYSLAMNQFLYFDAAFYAKLFGQNKIKQVQPDVALEK